MKALKATALWMLAVCSNAAEGAGPAKTVPVPDVKSAAAASVDPASEDAGARANRRYDEMLGKMQASVEEIAQLYGNPVFLQVFTNDEERASELKQRLHAARTGEEIRHEITDLEKKRDDLLNDIALRKRESIRLAERLIRQRAALDALASAIEKARTAVEDTTR